MVGACVLSADTFNALYYFPPNELCNRIKNKEILWLCELHDINYHNINNKTNVGGKISLLGELNLGIKYRYRYIICVF